MINNVLKQVFSIFPLYVIVEFAIEKFTNYLALHYSSAEKMPNAKLWFSVYFADMIDTLYSRYKQMKQEYDKTHQE